MASKPVPFLERLAALNLPAEEFVVVGSGLMDVLGLRQADDIDLCISRALYDELARHEQWTIKNENSEFYVTNGDCEAWTTWNTDQTNLDFVALLGESQRIDGYNFTTPQRLLRWKQEKRRPKDVPDIALLERYLGQKSA